MEQQYYIAKVDYDEALKYAEICSIINDLESVKISCNYLMKLLKDEPKDNILIESLWISSLIRYARCFATGKRFQISEDVFSALQGEPVKVHQTYIDLRNKHIAHSVTLAEQFTIGLLLSPKDSKEKKIEGIAVLMAKLICTDVDDVWQIGSLADVVQKKMMEICKIYENKALEVGKSLSIDKLYSSAQPQIIKGENDYQTPR
jgi:hypothetical protein